MLSLSLPTIFLKMMRNQKLQTQKLQKKFPKRKSLPEDAYSILGFSEQRLSEELKDWTYYNGYSQAVSATFYSDMTIDFNLGSYVMQCVLDDPDQTVITVEYLKKRDKITFHL